MGTVLGSDLLPRGLCGLRAHHLRRSSWSSFPSVSSDLKHTTSWLRHDLRVIHRYPELLVPSFLPGPGDRVNQGLLSTWAYLIVILVISRVLEALRRSEEVAVEAGTHLVAHRSLRNLHLVRQLVQRKSVLQKKLAVVVRRLSQLRLSSHRLSAEHRSHAGLPRGARLYRIVLKES